MDTESRYLRDIRDAIKGIAKRSGMDVSGNAKTKYLKEIADAIRENGGGGKDGNDKVKQEMIDTGSDDPIVFSESLSTNTGFVGKSSHFTYSPGSKTVKLTDGPAIPNKEAKITPESETFLNKIKTDVDESTYDETRYSAKVSTASNGYGIQFIKSDSTTSNPAGGPGPVTVEKTRAYTEIRHNAVAVTNIDNDPNTGFNRTMTLKDDDIVMGGETPNTWDGTNTSLKSALAAAKKGNFLIANIYDSDPDDELFGVEKETETINITSITSSSSVVVPMYADKTYDEIKTAMESGLIPLLKDAHRIYSVYGYDFVRGSIIFKDLLF